MSLNYIKSTLRINIRFNLEKICCHLTPVTIRELGDTGLM